MTMGRLDGEEVMEERKWLPSGQFKMNGALAKSIERSHKAFVQLHDEVEEARNADWKMPDGKPWKFSWELEKK